MPHRSVWRRALTRAAAVVAACGCVAALTGMGAPESESNADMSWTLFATLKDARITESSGLAVAGGRLLTVNDGGDASRVYDVDPATGETVRAITFNTENKPRDPEAMAVGPGGTVWVADIGDNRHLRKKVIFRRFVLPSGDADVTVESTRATLAYPSGAKDAEAFAVHPVSGAAIVITKGLLGGDLFRLPNELSLIHTNHAELVGPMPALVTDAAFTPDGSLLHVRSYTQVYTYAWPSMQRIGQRELPAQHQGETLTVTGDGTVLIGSEGRNSPVLALHPDVPWSEPTQGYSTPTAGAAPSPSPDLQGEEVTQRAIKDVVPASLEQYLIYWPLIPVALVAVLLLGGWIVRWRTTR